MFKNRAVQIGLVKKAEVDEMTADGVITTERIVVLGEIADQLARRVVIGVATYVALDTVRKIMIENAKRGRS